MLISLDQGRVYRYVKFDEIIENIGIMSASRISYSFSCLFMLEEFTCRLKSRLLVNLSSEEPQYFYWLVLNNAKLTSLTY